MPSSRRPGSREAPREQRRRAEETTEEQRARVPKTYTLADLLDDLVLAQHVAVNVLAHDVANWTAEDAEKGSRAKQERPRQ